MEEVYQIFEGDGWESGKALVKTGAFYADVWRDVISLKVYRDLEAILDSYKRSGYLFRYSPEEIRFIMERQLKKMDEIDCPAIYSDEVVKGDYGRLKEAVEHCGYTFDKDLVDSVVDKELYAIN